MKIILSPGLSALLLSACSSGSSGSGGGGSSGPQLSQAVQGTDLTGNWKLVGVQCFNSTFTTTTTVATVNNDYQEVMAITGNTMTDTSSQGGCTVIESNNINFSGNSQYSATSISVASVTNGSCQQTLSFSSGITPGSSTTTISANQSIPNVNGSYLTSSSLNAFGLYTNLSDGTSGDACFLIYLKQ